MGATGPHAETAWDAGSWVVADALELGGIGGEMLETMLLDYRAARMAWKESSLVREAAEVLGMNEREYADRYVRLLRPFGYSFSTTNTGTMSTMTFADVDEIFRRAGD